MIRVFQILAVVLVGTAAFFLWRGDTDMTFASIVIAACAYFLSLRFQMKPRVAELERQRYLANEETDDEQQ